MAGTEEGHVPVGGQGAPRNRPPQAGSSGVVADRHGIGGNHPPAPLTAVEVTRYLADVEGRLLGRRDELMAGVARFNQAHPFIIDDETQGHAGDFAKQISAAIKQCNDAHALHKRPFLEGGRAVDSFFKGTVETLKLGLADVRRPMLAFALKKEAEEREQRRLDAAAAQAEADRIREQLADEQMRAAEQEAALRTPVTIEEAIVAADVALRADRAADARAADLTRTRGDLGSVSSVRELWDVEVEDLSLVPPQYLMFDVEAARRDVQQRQVRDIPGCRVFLTKHIQTR